MELRALRLTTSATGLFVGRESEMVELSASLDDARSGRGRIVMLAGEPGIGKTTMAEAIATIGAGQGFTTLWGRCPEQRGAPPYWPWAQIIRSSIAHSDGDTIRKTMASHAHVISEVEPDVIAHDAHELIEILNSQ